LTLLTDLSELLFGQIRFVAPALLSSSQQPSVRLMSKRAGRPVSKTITGEAGSARTVRRARSARRAWGATAARPGRSAVELLDVLLVRLHSGFHVSDRGV
jgi:hypothetical protein